MFPSLPELAALSQDLKKTKLISDAAIALLNDERFFTFVAVLPKRSRLHATRQDVLRSIDQSIHLISTWQNAAMHQDIIRSYQSLRADAQAKSFNCLLYDRMLLAATFAAIVAALIIQEAPAETPPEAIGWFSDRDAIVEKSGGLAQHLFSVVLNDYCIASQLKFPPQYGFIGDHMHAAGAQAAPTRGEQWYDPIIRVADYYGGSIGEIDYDAIEPGKKVRGTSPKYDQLLSLVFSDNERLTIVRFKGKLSSLAASLVSFSHTPSRDDK